VPSIISAAIRATIITPRRAVVFPTLATITDTDHLQHRDSAEF
jgi:hypothetical protein